MKSREEERGGGRLEGGEGGLRRRLEEGRSADSGMNSLWADPIAGRVCPTVERIACAITLLHPRYSLVWVREAWPTPSWVGASWAGGSLVGSQLLAFAAPLCRGAARGLFKEDRRSR